MIRSFIAWLEARRERRRSAILTAAEMLHTFPRPAEAWGEARERRREAEARGSREADRHWNAVMRAIERQSGYRHQPDTATRYIDP